MRDDQNNYNKIGSLNMGDSAGEEALLDIKSNRGRLETVFASSECFLFELNISKKWPKIKQ